MDEFVFPMAIVKRHRGVMPDNIEGTVRACWASGDDFYFTVLEQENEEIEFTHKIALEWMARWREFDSGTELEITPLSGNETMNLGAPCDYLKSKKPSFQFGEEDHVYVLAHGKYHYDIRKKRTDVHYLRDVLRDLLGRDDRGVVLESGSYRNVARVLDVIEAVSGPVADAVVEMSTWKGDRYGGVQGTNHIDARFQDYSIEGVIEGERAAGHEEIARKCKQAGIECTAPVYILSFLGPQNIWLDKKTRGFVGFAQAGYGGFAPRDWAYADLVDGCALRTGSRLQLYGSATDLWGHHSDLTNDPTFRNLWAKALAQKLTARGFRQPDPQRFTWRIDRGPARYCSSCKPPA